MYTAADLPLPAESVEPSRTNPSSTLSGQIGRFAFTGGGSVAIDLVVYLALFPLLGSVAAKAISYICGVSFGFVGNKFWTFRSSQAVAAEVPSYVAVYAVTLAVNLMINAAAIAVLSYAAIPTRATQILAFLLATGVTTVANFLGLKFITFRNTRLALD